MPSAPHPLAVVVLLFGPAQVDAQGGRHRGPGTGDAHAGVVPVPGMVPGPGRIPGRGFKIGPDLTTWKSWWAFNQDQFLPSHPSPREPINHEAIVRALVDASGRGPTKIRAASLLALGKIGRSIQGRDLVSLLEAGLLDTDPFVRESATLALGLSGHAAALQPLTAVALRETGDKEQAMRLREAALYAIGLLAANQDRLFKRRAFSTLHGILRSYGKAANTKAENLHVAAVHGIALLGWDSKHPNTDTELRTLAIRCLERVQSIRTTRRPVSVQVHAPFAIARVLGRGKSPAHQKAKDRLIANLGSRASPNVHSSAVLALGEMAMPAEQFAGHAPYSEVLRHYFDNGRYQQAKMFSLLALGQIGGHENESFLLDILANGRKVIDRPWAAVALATLHHRLSTPRQSVRAEAVGARLIEQIRHVKTPWARAGFAIALGILNHRPAVPYLADAAAHNESKDEFSGYLGIALGLLSAKAKSEAALEMLERSTRRPTRAILIAPAVGWLAPANAGPVMLEQLQTSAIQPNHCAGLAMGMGSIRAPEFVATLISTLQDQTQPARVRAYAAAALGRIAEWRKTPWSVSLTEGLNYRALPRVLVHEGRGILEQL